MAIALPDFGRNRIKNFSVKRGLGLRRIFTSSYGPDVCLDAVMVQITISGIEHSQIALGHCFGIFFSFKVTLREVPFQV